MAAKLGLIIPTNFGEGPPPTRELLRFCSRAEELGFESLWIIDRLFDQNGVPHPFVMLSQAAAVTQRIGLGTGVILLSVRHPVEVAQQAASLNAMSGERLTLGVSQGGRDNEYTAADLPKEQRTGRLVEGVEVLRRLWSEKVVSLQGRYYTLEGADIEPKPSRAGGIPIVFGAVSEPPPKRTGRRANDWMQGSRGTSDAFASAWRTVQQSVQGAGRDPAGLHSSKLFYVNPDAEATRAASELEAYLSLYYGPGYPMDQTAFGTPETIAEKIVAFATRTAS